MIMKNFKTSLHILLSVASLVGFLGGWATLAHSRKPLQTTGSDTTTQTQLDPLPPLPALDANTASSSNGSGFFSVAPQQQTRRRSRAFFTTSGS
jgi:hypothetical protein